MKQEATQTGEDESIIIEALREIVDLEADSDMYCGLLERVLELKPDDIDARFKLAYKYSEKSQDELSSFTIHEYLKISVQRIRGIIWGCSTNIFN